MLFFFLHERGMNKRFLIIFDTLGHQTEKFAKGLRQLVGGSTAPSYGRRLCFLWNEKDELLANLLID